jgi:type IV pilus assembly protein PilV
MRRQTGRGYAQPGGFTLLEVLVALLVLACGLLGLAALQTTGLRASQVAGMRTLVARLGYDITERMRANPAGVAAHAYVIGRTATATRTVPATRASRDLVEWSNAVARLPGGRGEIAQCTPATTPACPIIDGSTTHVVTLYWNESRTTMPATYHCPPWSDADFRCFRLLAR